MSLGENVLRVDVTDTGIGIAPEDQAKVLDRFYRADHPAVVQQESEGLALAETFVDMQGGRIWVDSDLDQAREHFHSADHRRWLWLKGQRRLCSADRGYEFPHHCRNGRSLLWMDSQR